MGITIDLTTLDFVLSQDQESAVLWINGKIVTQFAFYVFKLDGDHIVAVAYGASMDNVATSFKESFRDDYSSVVMQLPSQRPEIKKWSTDELFKQSRKLCG